MDISPHLIIDAVILSTALTITLLLRAKGNAARKEKESKWLPEKARNNSKNLNYLESTLMNQFENKQKEFNYECF